jgi:hypothetical protein
VGLTFAVGLRVAGRRDLDWRAGKLRFTAEAAVFVADDDAAATATIACAAITAIAVEELWMGVVELRLARDGAPPWELRAMGGEEIEAELRARGAERRGADPR